MHLPVLVLLNTHYLNGSHVALTALDIEIIFLLAIEHTAKAIGEKVFLSATAVHHHILELYEKTGRCSYNGLVAFGFINKILIEENGKAVKNKEEMLRGER